MNVIGIVSGAAVTAAALLTLFGCGGGSDTTRADVDSDTSGNNGKWSYIPVPGLEADIEGKYYVGVMYLSEGSESDTSDALAAFFSTTQAPHIQVLKEDACDDPTTLGVAPPYQMETVPGTEQELNAGENLTVSSGSDLYGELSKPLPEKFPGSYFWATKPTAAIPDNLKLNIPGADFPQVLGATFPIAVEPLIVTEPAPEGTITQDTVYRWAAGSNPEAKIMITWSAGDQQGEEGLIVTCRAKDDGEFSLPADTQAQLGVQYNAKYSSITRFVTSFHVEDSVAIQLEHSYHVKLR